MRFEPGDTKTVTLVALSGDQHISGGNNLALSSPVPATLLKRLVEGGFAHVPEPGALSVREDTTMTRAAYASMFGPTVGDRVRLGDTALWIEVERDLTTYGDEVKFGGGMSPATPLFLSSRMRRQVDPRRHGSSYGSIVGRMRRDGHHQRAHR